MSTIRNLNLSPYFDVAEFIVSSKTHAIRVPARNVCDGTRVVAPAEASETAQRASAMAHAESLSGKVRNT
ncbi:MAG: hypothetical protein WB810_06565 [Candidatus Cybelea sp.]